MAEKGLSSVNIESMEEALHRLSKKPGVKAWLMLDRSDGAVLKTSGQIAAVRPAKSSANANNAGAPPSLPTPTSGSFSADVHTNTDSESLAAQELASMVWKFLSSAGSLVEEIDSEDELKLLRLRTKNQEFVIVPEPKYLLVVIHDTPLA
ncbi:hypothetical protein F5X97DRAFT_283036 [Nemania serpens]|nr:hypothetical protein F5X97DRAFT_283036 [Nemania serpens]